VTPQMRHQLRERGELVERRPLGDRCWQAARVLRGFDASELAACAECELSAARRWIRELSRAGYMRLSGTRAAPRALLIRDTGPQAPLIQKRFVRDFNTKQDYPK
jgi:hypothetical protein